MISNGDISLLQDLVLPLQLLGMFPYTWNKNNPFEKGPAFSVKLFLWSVFINMFTVPVVYYCYDILLIIDNARVGNFVVKLVFVYLAAALIFLCLLSLAKSQTLATILRYEGTMIFRECSAKCKSQLRKIMALSAVLTSLFSFCTIGISLANPKMFDLSTTILASVMLYITNIRAVFIQLLFKFSFMLLAENFLTDIREHIQEPKDEVNIVTGKLFSSLITSDPNTTHAQTELVEKQNIKLREEMMEALCKIEGKICKVSRTVHYVIFYFKNIFQKF